MVLGDTLMVSVRVLFTMFMPSCLLWAERPLVAAYHPSLATGKVETQLLEMEYGGREVPMKIYLPAQKHAPVILLSHEGTAQ